MTEKGSSLLETRRRNRVLIKKTIFRTVNATRADIAETLGLTLPTITTSVNEMLEDGILEEFPLPGNSMVNAAGRHPNAIAFRADAGYAIGVELGPYETRGVLLNLKGEILKSTEEVPAREHYDEMLLRVTHIVRELMEGMDRGKLLGVGVGLPGFIDEHQGVIRSNPRRDWSGQKFAPDLERELELPVLIGNNVRLRAIGHELSIHGRIPDIFAYFYVSKGIACPLMIRDNVLSGYTAGAGELGQSILYVDIDGKETCRRVDDLGSERAILERCQEAMLAGRLPGLRERLTRRGYLTMEDILEEEQLGCGELCGIFDQAMEYLGVALSNVVNLINPDYVVVDGYIFQNKRNRDRLLTSARNHLYGLNEAEVLIYIKEYDPFCGAKGAAYHVIGTEFLEK